MRTARPAIAPFQPPKRKRLTPEAKRSIAAHYLAKRLHTLSIQIDMQGATKAAAELRQFADQLNTKIHEG